MVQKRQQKNQNKGFYTEDIVDSPTEKERTRFLDIYYYLVDDSGQLVIQRNVYRAF